MAHSMLRRCHTWDYRGKSIYMITLTLADRSRPLLGKVVPDAIVENTEDIQAHLEPSALGRAVIELWKALPESVPQLRPLFLQLMEEHLHFIIQVTAPLSRPIGFEIAAFKAHCTQEYGRLCGGTGPLFSTGFQDTILLRKGQLTRMFNYLKENPRRFLIKKMRPEFFHSVRLMPFSGGNFVGVGNSFLLERAKFYQVQASRSISSDELERKREDMQSAVAGGAVIVSPCISPAEKTLANEAFDSSAPLIVLKNQGFPPFYKPPGRYFNACADGRLLMLAPQQFAVRQEKTPLSREDACVLNRLAQLICGEDAVEIDYHGMVPQDLDALVARALVSSR